MARGSGEGGEVASGLGCDGRRHGEARRDAAVTAVVTAVAEGDGGARGEAAAMRERAAAGPERERGSGQRYLRGGGAARWRAGGGRRGGVRRGDGAGEPWRRRTPAWSRSRGGDGAARWAGLA